MDERLSYVDSDITNFQVPPISLFEKYKPQDKWFNMEQGIGGLHNVSHHTRVSVLAVNLAKELQPEVLDLEALLIASSIHDTKRTSDGVDPDHGLRAAQFAQTEFGGVIPDTTLEKVMRIAAWHDRPHKECFNPMPLELLILREADKLDRQRDSKRKDNFDPTRLQLDHSRKLIHPANVFYKLSRWYELQGMDGFYGTMEAGIELGLVCNE